MATLIAWILVARDLWVDATQEQIVGKRRAGCELLCSLQDDATVALGDDAGAQCRVCLRVRWFAAVDLRRREGIGNVEMVVAGVLVERNQVVRIALPCCREECRIGGEPREESGDMIGCAAHQTEGVLGPALDHAAARTEIFRPPRDVIAPEHRPAGPGRRVGHQLAVGRVRGDIPQPGNRLRGAAKGGVAGYVSDHLAVVDNLASIVTDRRQVIRAGTQAGRGVRCILRQLRWPRCHRAPYRPGLSVGQIIELRRVLAGDLVDVLGRQALELLVDVLRRTPARCRRCAGSRNPTSAYPSSSGCSR